MTDIEKKDETPAPERKVETPEPAPQHHHHHHHDDEDDDDSCTAPRPCCGG